MKKLVLLLFSVLLLSSDPSFAQNAPYELSTKEWTVWNLPTIPGWCTKTKCTEMMDLIFQVKPDVCVEIGVYGGSSLFPTAVALKYLNKGVVYGIDPWDTAEFSKYSTAYDTHLNWWRTIDMNSMYQQTMNMVKTNDLQKHCTILRMTSEAAAPLIPSIDILHIDGTHLDEEDLVHVTQYLPKVKIGGYVWYNGWSTSPKAYEYVKKTCYIRKVIDTGTCILLEKVRSE